MLDLLPGEITRSLHGFFGERFGRLNQLAKLILSTAEIESTVTHARMLEVSTSHPHDMSKTFRRLIEEKFLVSHGSGRGTVYHLAGKDLPNPDEIFSSPINTEAVSGGEEEEGELSSMVKDISSGGIGASSGGIGVGSGGMGKIVEGLSKPLIDNFNELIPELKQELTGRASNASSKRRVAPDVLQDIIRSLCEDNFVTLKVLAELLDRSEDYLRKNHLNYMVVSGSLERAFPAYPNHPKQAYTSSRR